MQEIVIDGINLEASVTARMPAERKGIKHLLELARSKLNWGMNKKIINQLTKDDMNWDRKIKNIRDRYVFNVGNSGNIAAKTICKILASSKNNGSE